MSSPSAANSATSSATRPNPSPHPIHPRNLILTTLRPGLIAAAAFSIFINLMTLGPVLYMMQVYDRVLSSRSLPTLWMLTLATGIALVASGLVELARGRLLQAAAALLDRRLGASTLQAVVRELCRVRPNTQLNPLQDLAVLRGFFSGQQMMAIFDTPWLLVFMALIFLFHPVLGLIALGGSLSLVVLAIINERISHQALERYQQAANGVKRWMEQGLRHADVLNSMGLARRFAEQWQARNDHIQGVQHELSQRLGRVQALSRWVRQAIQVVMMGAGAYLVIHDNLSPGIMIAATILLGRAMAPVESLIAHWKGLSLARGAYRRFVQWQTQALNAPERQALPPFQGRVTVQNAQLAGFDANHPILRDLSFEVPAGASIAILGPSGSGKSSLAKLLVGVWQADRGHVRLDGADITHWDPEQLGAALGYLPQDVSLLDGTVADNIGRMSTDNRDAILRAAQAAHAYDLILKLPNGFETPLGEGGIQLSAGQAQRIGLARALYGQPRLVVLDEPNANLDAEGEWALVQTMADLKAQGVTQILITHKPSLVQSMDALIVMREGRIELMGPRDEVLARLQPSSAPASASAKPNAANANASGAPTAPARTQLAQNAGTSRVTSS